jgi:7-cyano-7-deazaguanine synthase in queuosine biosynthesis
VTSLYLRTDPEQHQPRGSLLLDWFGRGGSSTVSGSLRDITQGVGAPTQLAADLLCVAVGVYGADKVVVRERQPDRWTRRLRLHIPVSDPARWKDAAPLFQEALTFLTNDHWQLRFRQGPARQEGGTSPLFGADAVSLFSGGLDSLAGAIDLLQRGESVLLLGHYDSNLLLPRQQHLFRQLELRYGADRVSYRPFYLRLASASTAQARPLPREREATTRSRSLLFVAAAGVAASALGLTRVYMPENGYIGLNVPLESSRLGACSTRTTHPYFLELLARALEMVDGPRIANPYQLLTKAEVLSGCQELNLLRDLAPSSISCAHPEVGRWREAGYGNCGYCYPCLMRRVALHSNGADDVSAYRIDAGDPDFIRAGGVSAGHIRALIDNARRPIRPTDVLRSGPIPRGRASEFSDLYARGRAEIGAWLDAAVPASR